MAAIAPLVFVPLVAWSKDAAVVALFACAIAIVAWPSGRRAVVEARPAGWLAGLMLMGWGLISLAWAPAGGAVLWGQVAMVVGAATVVVRGIDALDAQLTRHLAATFAAAVGLLALILFIERVSGGGLIGLHRPDEPTARLFDVLSAGLAFLCCLTFPAALILAHLFRPSVGIAFAIAVFALAVSYNMDAAPVALAFGGLVCGTALLGGRRVLVGLVLTLSCTALVWGVLAEAALAGGLGAWLERLFGANWSLRLGYWARVQELIGQAPLIGHGFGAGRVLGRPGEYDGPVPVPFMHPHNGVLELWLDLGLMGVALVATWTAAGARRILSSANSPAVLATIAATIAVTSVFVLVSFSIWLGSWLSALGLIIAAMALAAKLVDQRQS
ncbi:MAG: O-antigen ligase family protein [Rhodospirillaceae bacterium]|nr:O-antigen ligase family protein [Rhodospirillaceae bacterium]